MKKLNVSLAIILLSITGIATAQLGLTNDEIVKALKDALNIGADKAVSMLNKTDGYYADAAVKILLPAEAKNIYTNINRVPGGKAMLDKAVVAINRAAEDAAKEAKPIFVNAIKTITITDGINIVKGADNSATMYLQQKTYAPLTSVYSTKINTSLSKPLVGAVSANMAYDNLVKAYNTASLNGRLFARIKTGTLAQHVTQKALDGVFLKIADEEKKIRKDPMSRVTDLLKKVFG